MALLDEAQQLTQSQVIYIMSRLRSDAEMKPKMRMTCNPAGKGHWLTNWLEWYLLPTGLPDPDKCGVRRYFTMRDSQLVWGNTAGEVLEQVPGCMPLSFTFISSTVYDNPVNTSGLRLESLLNNPNIGGSLEQIIPTQH